MSDLVSIFISITMGLLLSAAGISVLRLLRGPSLADRIMAVDFVAALVAAVVVVDNLRSESLYMMDVAVVTVIISFIATVAFSRIMEAHRHD